MTTRLSRRIVPGAILPIAACVLAIGIARPAAAQTSSSAFESLSLEQLLAVPVDKVFSASRFVQDVSRAPASVTVILGEDIRQFGYRTLADALRSVPGFYTTYDRNYTYLGVRGFLRPGDYNSRVLVLIDGHRYNEGVYDGALIGTEFPIDVALIERIEVIRGPSSSLYGNSAFFGAVNVVTRGSQGLRGVEVEGEAGTLGTRRGRISGGGQSAGGATYVASASVFRSRGQTRIFFPEFDSAETRDGVAERQDDDGFQSVFGKAKTGNLLAEAGWASRTKRVPTASYGTIFGDPRFETTDARAFVTLQYGRTIGDRTEAVGRVFADAYRYHGQYPYEPNSEIAASRLEMDSSTADGVGGEAIVRRRFRGLHVTTAGAEWRDTYRLGQRYEYAGEPGSEREIKTRTQAWAVFGQQELALKRDVLVSAGIRYDHDSSFGGTVNPRLGVILMPSRPTTIKLVHGTAFRAPSAYERLYWDDQEKLDPETIRTSEAIWEQRIGTRVRTSASIFSSAIDRLISEGTSEATGELHFVNLDRATARGTEWTIEGRWPAHVVVRGGYTWERVQNPRTGAALSNAPRHLAKLAVAVPIGSLAIAGFDGEYVGRRQTVRGDTVGGFYRQNLTVSGTALKQRLDLRFTIGNLFDRRYGDPGAEEHRQSSILQDGRTATLSLGYRF